MANARYTARRPPKQYDHDWLREELRAIESASPSVITASATYDPANLVDGAGVTTTVAVVGARVGDYVQASFALDLQGVQLHGWVSAADVVSVRFQNETGGAVDLGSGIIRVRVVKA